MADNTQKIIINGSKEVINAINAKINEQSGSQSQVAERKNLDGDTATWIVIATLANQALPHVLSFIKSFLGGQKVTKIVIGDLQAENPTSEMVENFEKILKSRIPQAEKNE